MHSKLKYEFVLVCPGRTYRLRAPSAQALALWVTAISSEWLQLRNPPQQAPAHHHHNQQHQQHQQHQQGVGGKPLAYESRRPSAPERVIRYSGAPAAAPATAAVM